MNESKKALLLKEAKKNLVFIQARIKENLAVFKNKIQKNIIELRRAGSVDRLVQEQLLAHNEQRIMELTKLLPSPYFVRCVCRFDDETEDRTLFFAKFYYTEEKIYSWITPTAAIRFEDCGKISYKKYSGEIRTGTMYQKDQFMIVDGKIILMTIENKKDGKKLVHQDYFSQRKTGFVLPEIVEQMEKVQDQVIRAHHIGPFAISGPAGSGKTTLALHRVAYLAQSPETHEDYPSEAIVVFVQDQATKNYFSGLLPELGINNVEITTFSEWAKMILGVEAEIILRYGNSELEKDMFEYEKNKLLGEINLPKYSKIHFKHLDKLYSQNLSPDMYALFRQQKQAEVTDIYDLVLLLKSYLQTFPKLAMTKEYYVKSKDNLLTRKTKVTPLDYALIIIDEFQNYLPDQLQIIRTTVREKNKSIIYVGDLNQQTRFNTISDWHELGGKMPADRIAMLNKVYRNTGNILKYINSLGYIVDVPKKIKMGSEVREKILTTSREEINYIQNIIQNKSNKIIGIITKEEDYLFDFKKAFKDNKNIIYLSMNQVQGVEFDIVFIVGINQGTFEIPKYPESCELEKQKQKIYKDLLYVALTRAIEDLHILGTKKLSDMIRF